MNRLAIAWLLAACGVCTALAQAPASETPKSRRVAATLWSEEGLSKIAVKGLDVVYAKPGATLAGYKQMMLRPISVAFQRDWEKQSAPGSRIPIGAKDSQRIKDRLAALVREEVVRQLSEGGYTLVDAPGEDVLDVELSIIDLNVAAPDIQSAGRVETFGVSAGEMTLVAALRDSVTGDVAMNGTDAMANVGSARAITLHTHAHDADGVQVSVADVGSGIPEEDLERIFAPFVTSKTSGIGLGLAVCVSIIHTHRGTIWATNNPIRGATVHFKVPAVEDMAAV